MEKELNIAAILKEKPKGTKLWSPIFGECTFDEISCNNSCLGVDTNKRVPEVFYANGKYDENGECTIFPSKEMRDWSKFAWKKGDVLVSNDGGTEVIFDKWYNDTYTSFYGKHCLDSENENNIKYFEGFVCTTERYFIESKDAAQTYINTIEERLGGKLNLETLEIEKQPEFKDGDIVVLDGDGKSHYKTILLYQTNIDDKYEVYSLLNTGTSYLCLEAILMDDRKARPATDSEKQQLFEALAKEGKAWDAEKKQIVDLPKKCEFKPFDKVLGRNEKDDVWEAELFSHYKEESQYPFRCIGFSRKYCIPYNEETAHLLGTTDDWEGGEHD